MTEVRPHPLSGDELERLSELLQHWTGMTFGEKRGYYLERRLRERMRRSGSADPCAYFTRLLADAAERQALINAVTINETYFYREDHQLAALSKDILPEIASRRRPGDRIRIWSLPCSTGEEGYSIALWLLDNWPMVDAYHVEIVGSDIDTDALAAAREGRYGQRALARLPDAARQAYFEPEHNHEFRIIEDLRQSVTFTQINLIDSRSVGTAGKFDVIFCRNLLIYFDEPARTAAAANLFDALDPGGYLCLGHSESMARIDPRFTFVRLDDAIVYRRD
ncbi:CheR family methyltransferase [Flavisphingomonas formosensis]|uniref:CheR family methyltransferase n=1 Tax=Flavisphingomonas formosensis TaxID=861534 RepID=UPI0012FC88A9|nr:protein-glutamate O-methyltransferase CheR [Sphingomonas formosensis]